MSGLSIRWRMTLWNTATFAVLLVGFGVLVYALLRQTHYDQLDRALSNRLEKITADPMLQTDPRAALAHWLAQPGRHVELFSFATADDGSRLFGSEKSRRFVQAEPRDAISNQRQFASLAIPEGKRLRRLSVSLSTSEGDYRLTLLADRQHTDEELQQVLATLLVTIPMTLLVAATLAHWLARKAFSPLERLCQLANQITADRLDRRLPIDNPDDEIGRMSETVNSMVARLQQSFQEVQRFTADASHELRTPIAVIRSEAELGRGELASDAPARRRLDSILEECTRLGSITSQLLMLSREDAGVGVGDRRTGPVALHRVLAQATDALRPLAEARGQTLDSRIDDQLQVQVEPDRLWQVVHNLVDNAIKYTPPAGTITVQLSRDHQQAVVTVADDGPGIGAEHLPRIFDRFYRVEKSDQRTEGAGLGLSIVQSIVRSLGGTVDVDSQPGSGTRFTVRLKLAEPC